MADGVAPPMYRVRPYFEIKKVKLPDCMYSLKPVHQLVGENPSSAESTASALSYLEQRQEWMLSQIGRLQERVHNLGHKMGVSPADVGILQQVGSQPLPQDVVISCPSSSPPYLLLTLYNYISRKFPCACRVHVHSSVVGMVTPHLRAFFGKQSSSPNPQLKITLIWKSESLCPVPTMVVSAHSQTPVEGLANITRYICRECCPELYEGLGAEGAAKVDGWLDIVTITLLYGTSKEKASVMRKMNSQLGGSTRFLVGEQFSLADVVAFGIICSQSDLKPTANVKQWMQRCQALPDFADIPCNYLCPD